MNRSEALRSRILLFGSKVLRGLLLYALFPVLCLVFLARPISNAVHASETAVYLILLATAGIVCLNWLVYRAAHRKHPTLPVFAHGVFCVLLAVIAEYEALLDTCGSVLSVLSVLGGCLALLYLFLISFWFASCHSKAAHSAAVVLWVIIGFVSVFMLYRIIRDFESGKVNAETWITIVILAALIPAAFTYKIRASIRRKQARRRASGLTEGKIRQIVGETRLDRDDELVTDYYALISYTVGDTDYETKAGISKLVTRWFGRKAFVGQEIPVHYDPDNPGDAYADRIDRHFFDQKNAKA